MELNLHEGQYFGNEIKSFENDFINLNISQYGACYTTEKHYHQNDYLSVLMSGKYAEWNSNEKENISVGTVLFRPRLYTHKNDFAANGGTCFNIEFKNDWQQKLELKTNLPEKFIKFKTGNLPSVYKLLVNFLTDFDEDAVLQFLSDYLVETDAANNLKAENHKINKIVQILETELAVFHSLISLSDRLLLHPVYVSRAFKQKTGYTISQYQLKVKVQNACRLLLETKLSISAISFQNGFFDDAHFINAFRSTYAISPHQFRLKVKG